MDTNTKIGIVIGLLIVVAIPLMLVWNTNKKIEAEKHAEIVKQVKIDRCLDDAYNAYIEGWNSACKRLGYAPNCSLLPVTYNIIESRYENQKQDCLNRYK